MLTFGRRCPTIGGDPAGSIFSIAHHTLRVVPYLLKGRKGCE
jgi:hypothetical protein